MKTRISVVSVFQSYVYVSFHHLLVLCRISNTLSAFRHVFSCIVIKLQGTQILSVSVLFASSLWGRLQGVQEGNSPIKTTF